MPAAPILDAEAMLLPVPGDDPAGRPLGLRERNLLKEYREEHDPAKLSADDLKDYALANKPRKLADWPKLFEFGTDYLVTHGKDLRLVMLMTEAAVHTSGFRGLRDSLKLIRRLCEECWGAMLPAIDFLDPPVSDWATQRFRPEHVGEDDVGSIDRRAGNLFAAFGSSGWGADDFIVWLSHARNLIVKGQWE